MQKLKLNKKIITEKQFEEKRFAVGYDPTQVDAFLDEIVNDYDIFEENINELKEEISKLKKEKESKPLNNATPLTAAANGANFSNNTDPALTNDALRQAISQTTGTNQSNIGRIEAVPGNFRSVSGATKAIISADGIEKPTTAKKESSIPNQTVKGGMADILKKVDKK